MDKETLISSLNKFFCETDRDKKRYSEVWLTDVDFGGLYYNGKYVLNVKAEHQINSCSEEIKSIISMMDKDAKDELDAIWSVAVYNANDDIHCFSLEGDIPVYNKKNACA